MRNLKISEFREKVTLCKANLLIDDELNRIEHIVPIKSVWSSVHVKGSVVDNTVAGIKPEITYSIIIRNQHVDFDYVRYRGKLLKLTRPYYEVDVKYIQIEAVEVDDKFAEFS